MPRYQSENQYPETIPTINSQPSNTHHTTTTTTTTKMPYRYPIHPFPIPPIPASAHPTQEDYIRDRNATTEIIFLHFRPNTFIEDPSTSAGELWTQALDSIRGSEEKGVQPMPGFGRLYWGRVEGGRSIDGCEEDVVLLVIGEIIFFIISYPYLCPYIVYSTLPSALYCCAKPI